MRILTCTSPGHFEYSDGELPALTKDHSLIKIKRIGICGTDLHAFEGTQPFFNYPRIFGHELAGEIADINGDIDFNIGETVTIIPYFNCGRCIACRNGRTNCCATLNVAGVHIDGGMAEYYSVPNYSLVHSNGLSVDSLALIEPLSIGAHGIRRADIKPGEFVLVVGAGPIGLGVMEFARIAGGQVIAIDISENRLNFCKEKLNIPYTINPLQTNAIAYVREITNGDMPTVVIDATGNLNAINNSFSFMAHSGRYILVGLQKGDISVSHPEFHKREATLMSSRNATREDFDRVIKSITNGNIKPENYITHRAPFSKVKEEFSSWLNPANGVIKAMVEMD